VIDNRRIATIGRQYFVAAVIAFVVFFGCGVAMPIHFFKVPGKFLVGGERFPRMRLRDFSGFSIRRLTQGDYRRPDVRSIQIPEGGEGICRLSWCWLLPEREEL